MTYQRNLACLMNGRVYVTVNLSRFKAHDSKVPGQNVCTIQRPTDVLCVLLQAVETLAAAGCDMIKLSDANTIFTEEINCSPQSFTTLSGGMQSHHLASACTPRRHAYLESPLSGELLPCQCLCILTPMLGTQHTMRPCLQPACRCTPMKLYERKVL